jgi:hypothetical protein
MLSACETKRSDTAIQARPGQAIAHPEIIYDESRIHGKASENPSLKI